VSVNGKAAAFIGTPPEMFYTHVFPSLPTGRLPFSPIGNSKVPNLHE
jgi:hypothetical protein